MPVSSIIHITPLLDKIKKYYSTLRLMNFEKRKPFFFSCFLFFLIAVGFLGFRYVLEISTLKTLKKRGLDVKEKVEN